MRGRRVGSDYKGGEGAQILFYSEFHHIIGTAFFVLSCLPLFPSPCAVRLKGRKDHINIYSEEVFAALPGTAPCRSQEK